MSTSFWNGVSAAFLVVLTALCALIAFGDLRCKRLGLNQEVMICGIGKPDPGSMPWMGGGR